MEINKRVIEEANCMLETNQTIRQIATIYHVSKSTVHKDLNERLKDINQEKYIKIKEILKFHTDIRHIRGGLSTINKYLKMG